MKKAEILAHLADDCSFRQNIEIAALRCLGYTVERNRADYWRVLDGNRWYAMPRVTGVVDDVVREAERRAAGWSLTRLRAEAYVASVDGKPSWSSHGAASALLRALVAEYGEDRP